MKRVPKIDRILTVTFRPDSRNSSKDYQIPRDIAEKLFLERVIFGDATNGGYMPNPASRYDVRQHLVAPERAEGVTRR